LTELLGVGAELRQAREASGLAIDDVAQQLKFAPRQIESLENERFDRLPGPTIARGMVRNYARLLKIDPEPLIERMAPRVEKAPDPAQIAARFRQPVPFSDAGKRSTLLYAGFSIGLLVLVGAVAFGWQQDHAVPEFVAPAQTQRAPSAPATQTAAATQLPQQVIAEPPPEEEKLVERNAEPQLARAVPQPAPERKPVAAEKKPVEAKADAALAPGVHRIVLRCEEEAWLEVRDATGRVLVSSLNPAGTERIVRARGPLDLVIGNAQHVKLIHNGTPVDLTPHIRVEVARLTLK
jgi:cytoskeleton protein RodZ